MKSWKNRLKSELDTLAPSTEKVCGKTVAKPEKRRGFFAERKNLAYAFSCAAAIAVIAVVLCVCLIPGVSDVPSVDKSACFAVEINPKAVFAADSEGKTESIVSLNGDADVLLGDGQDSLRSRLLGKPINEAIVTYIDEAAKLGFIDPDILSAIKISASDDKSDSLSFVKADAENYFKSKGFATLVADDKITATEMLSLCGKKEGDLYSFLRSAPYLYAERAAENASDIAALYKTDVVYGQIKTLLSEAVRSLDEISDILAEMSDLNEKIKDSEKNPLASSLFLMFSRDYWTLKNTNEEITDADFLALVTKTDSLNARYETLCGQKISSEAELKSVKFCLETAISALPVDTLKKLAEFVSDSDFDYYFDKVINILEKTGLKNYAEKIAEFTKSPEDANSFLEKVSSVYSSVRAARLNGASSAYDVPREALSDKEYAEAINKILAEYGSLSSFFDSKK